MLFNFVTRKKPQLPLAATAAILILATTFPTLGMQAQAHETQTIEIVLQPEATTIHWTLRSLLHKSQGDFKLKTGDIVVNPKTGLAQGEVLVDATSATGDDAQQTARWQKDILDTTTFPAIIFHPSKLEGLISAKGLQQVKASGALTLRGQDHAIDMPLAIEISGKEATITAHFTVPYTQWGLKPPSAGFGHFEKQVTIDLKARGVLKMQNASPAPPPAPDSQ